MIWRKKKRKNLVYFIETKTDILDSAKKNIENDASFS